MAQIKHEAQIHKNRSKKINLGVFRIELKKIDQNEKKNQRSKRANNEVQGQSQDKSQDEAPRERSR